MADLDPPFWLAVIAAAAALALLVDAVLRADWARASLTDHLGWALMTAVVFLGHQMHVPAGARIELHYLGAPALCLMLGYPRAMIAMAVVLLADHLLAPGGSLGLRFLLSAALPIWVIYRLLRFSQRCLPANLFVFLLGVGFIGLFVTYALQLLAAAAMHAWLGSWSHDGWQQTLPFALLLASGETVMEGMLITLFVVYAPRWVRLFDDRFYLRRPRHHGRQRTARRSAQTQRPSVAPPGGATRPPMLATTRNESSFSAQPSRPDTTTIEAFSTRFPPQS
ncbi:MAG: energy-coupling factor ABC transporter permease [Burkholderiaceae bacterium]